MGGGVVPAPLGTGERAEVMEMTKAQAIRYELELAVAEAIDPVEPGVTYHPTPRGEVMRRAMEIARRVLAEHGVPHIPWGYYADYVCIVALIEGELRMVVINNLLEVNVLPFDEGLERGLSHDFDPEVLVLRALDDRNKWEALIARLRKYASLELRWALDGVAG